MKADRFIHLNALGLFPLRVSPDSFLLYAPYAKEVRLCTVDEIRQMESRNGPLSDQDTDLFQARRKYEAGILPSSEKDIAFLSVLPTAACNFHCPYCYAGNMHNPDTLEPSQIGSALTYLLSKKRSDHFGFSITMIGGGEPTLRPDLIEYTVITAKRLAIENKKGIDLTLVTNGSRVTPDLASFLKQHNVHVRVSFDVLPDIQEKQRGCFHEVDSGLRLLEHAGCIIEVRTVVTPSNVGRLTETCAYLQKNYPFVKKLNLDPVVSEKAFENLNCFSSFCKDFQQNFLEALNFCAKSGLVLDNILTRLLLGGPRHSYCPGEISLSPDGTLSICHQKSTSEECRKYGFSFGEIDKSGKMMIRKDQFRKLLNHNEEQERCSQCFLQPVCRGGCKALNAAYSNAFKAIYCEHTRTFAIELLKLFIDTNTETPT